MSNTASINHIETPQNVKASVNNQLVDLTWTGPSDTLKGGFEHYNVYRSVNDSIYTFVGTSKTTQFVDSLLSDVVNSNYIYKVDGEYTSQVFEPSYSNQVTLLLFSNVQVKIKDKTSGIVSGIDGLDISISNDKGVTVTEKTNSSGYVLFKNVKIGDYDLSIFDQDSSYISDKVKVTLDTNNFNYVYEFAEPTATFEIEDISKVVYPNPTSGQFIVDLTGYDFIKHIDIVNTKGNIIKSLEINNQEKVFIDLSEEPVGLYIITITTETSSVKTKINYTK